MEFYAFLCLLVSLFNLCLVVVFGNGGRSGGRLLAKAAWVLFSAVDNYLQSFMSSITQETIKTKLNMFLLNNCTFYDFLLPCTHCVF